MEVEQPLTSMLNASFKMEGSNGAVDSMRPVDHLEPPMMLNSNMRAKSDQGALSSMPDDSPPRNEERRNALVPTGDSGLLSLEETTELFRIKVEDARRDTQQLAGSEDVSEVVIPNLTLDLGHSSISRIPEAVVDLIKAEVERLSLSHNQIWHIPLRFSECSHLRYLNIRSNVFREIPRGVFKLPLLEILDISRNKVRKIPKDVRNLTSLRVFSIAHNRIDDLPTEICEMTKLQILKVADNPLKSRIKKVIEAKEAELDCVGTMDNEREQAITAEIKKHLREFHPVALPVDVDFLPIQDDSPMDTPKPLKRVLSSRFPVVPSTASMDASMDGTRSSPSQGKPPPIPLRSHYRVTSGQGSNPRRSGMPTMTNGGERNRSNSETGALIPAGNPRQRRMGMLRKEKSDLDAIDETKVIRQSHLRGFSYNSSLRRNASISSPLAGSSSPSSPRIHYGHITPTSKRLSSLPEGKVEANMNNPIIEGGKGLLYSLHQIESQIRGLLAVVEASDTKQSSLEFTFYNASKWLKRLNKALEKAVSVDPEDGETLEKSLMFVQQNCADCVLAYKHVIGQLQDNVTRIVTDTDPRYVRTLMLLLFGSIVEIKNSMKAFGMELRGHKRQMSSGNTHPIQTIPEEFSTPQQPVRAGTPNRGRSGPRPQGGRVRSETAVQHPNFENGTALQAVQPPQIPQPPGSARLPPALHLTGSTLIARPPSSASVHTNDTSFNSYGFRSRSNSRTAFSSLGASSFSSVANTPRSGETFNMPPPVNILPRVNPVTGLTEAQEDARFEQIFLALSKAYEATLHALPLAGKRFQKCLELAEENRQSKDIRDLWLTLVQRCKACLELGETLQTRVVSMPHKDLVFTGANAGGGRNDPAFWLHCKTFLQSFIDLATDVRDAKNWHILPPDVLGLLRPVQRATRDASKLMETSPWRYLTDGTAPIPVAVPFGSQAGGNAHIPNNFGGGHQQTIAPHMAAYQSGLGHPIQHPIYSSQSASASAVNVHMGVHGAPYLNPPTNRDGANNGASPTIQIPATPLSAALGPAAQATIPSTPASASGDQFFKGDVFQRADSLLSMPQAGSVNFLNRR